MASPRGPHRLHCAASDAEDDTRPPTILTVDDSPLTRESLRLILERDSYRVVEAASGSEALLHAAAADVVLLDVCMPGISGMDVLSRLRATLPDVKVILLTGIHHVPTVVEAMRLGAFDYLTKPIDEHVVRSAVARALQVSAGRRRAGAAAASDQAAPILLVGPHLPTLATLQILLEPFFPVAVATSAASAVEVATQRPPRVAVVDDAFGSAEGLHVMRSLRRGARAAPLVVLTAEAGLAGRAGLADIVPEALVTGPYTADEVVGRVIRLAGRGDVARRSFTPYVTRAIKFIEEHYAAVRIGAVAAIAAGSYVSSSHLSYLFRLDVGMTMSRYLARFRVIVAGHLLGRNCTLDDIAAAVGFSDAPHLSRVFKQITGKSPGQFRQASRSA